MLITVYCNEIIEVTYEIAYIAHPYSYSIGFKSILVFLKLYQKKIYIYLLTVFATRENIRIS